jgi:hypothetical protein
VREETVKMLANLGTADIDFQEGDDIVDDVLDVPDLPADRKMLDLDLLHKVSHWDGVPDPVVPEVGARNARNDLPPYIPPSFHEYFAPQRLKVLSLLAYLMRLSFRRRSWLVRMGSHHSMKTSFCRFRCTRSTSLYSHCTTTSSFGFVAERQA